MKLVIALVLMAGLMFETNKSELSGSSTTNSKHGVLYEKGKRIFVSRCAKCHDEDASKKLPGGTTLVERLALTRDPEARLGTRLKDTQERHAVMIYMDDLIAQWRYSESRKK